MNLDRVKDNIKKTCPRNLQINKINIRDIFNYILRQLVLEKLFYVSIVSIEKCRHCFKLLNKIRWLLIKRYAQVKQTFILLTERP